MDMRMPVMDGYEATKRIKSQTDSHPAHSRLVPVIIALTAHAFEEERAAILAAGCDDFVRKPFREHEIFDKMAQHLGLRYVYQGLAPDGAAQTRPDLTPSDLADLPADWVAELHHAAARGRAKRILDLIEDIRPDHAHVAEVLAVWVHEFRFDKIIVLAEQGGNDK
jgi:CheY-like chemotaxis protein